MATARHHKLLDSIPVQHDPDGGAQRLSDRGMAGVAHRGARELARSAAGLKTRVAPAPASSPSQSRPPSIESLAPDPAAGFAAAPAGASAPVQDVVEGRRRRAPRTLAVTAALLAGALVAAGIVASVQRSARAAELVRAEARISVVVVGRAEDERFWQATDRAVVQTAVSNLRAPQIAAAGAAAASAQAVLAASGQVGDATRAALRSAVDALTATAAALGAGASLATLQTATTTLAATQRAAVDEQATWQAAEDVRLAAEQAAAEQAAAEQAAAGSAQKAAAKRATVRAAKPATASAPAPAASAGPATAGDVFSAGAIGAELNAYRATQGLAPLAIVSSPDRVTHAGQMAASNSIWHSTVRTMAEIVGWVQPVSASAMIAAYAASPPHNAIMIGSYSTAYVGAVTNDGKLYTSIQFR